MFLLVRWVGFILVGGWSYLLATEPDNVYLTWVADPTTTMTVVWQGGSGCQVMLHPKGASKWQAFKAESHTIPKSSIHVHVVQIEGLQGDSTYIFKIEGSDKEYQFRTLPQALSREVRFVVGGDIFYHWGKELFEQINHAISEDDPDFIVLGGDNAYTVGYKQASKGYRWEIERWQEFLRLLQKTLYGQAGRLIPIMPVVGNHDVHRRSGASQDPELFYEIFQFPEKGKAYRMMEAGDYLSLVFLDSGHTWPIDGVQAKWLKNKLQGCDTTYLFGVYHIGAYPSVYKYKGDIPEELRKAWVPLFEEARLSAAFEHHSHALKRTYPIRQGKKDPEGVIYLGDGSWGAPPRQVYTPEELWYLEKSASVNACWFVHLSPQGAEIEARTPEGKVVDQITLTPRHLLKSQE